MKVVYHPLMKESYDHTPAGAPGRLDTSVKILSEHPDYDIVMPKPATEQQLLLAHDDGTISRVKRESESSSKQNLYKTALLAAGGAILTGKIAIEEDVAFGLIRPPGHHASRSSYWGFCYFNNIAISLLELKNEGLIESAFLLDFDLHTGDGNINILDSESSFVISNPRSNNEEDYLREVRAVLESSPEVDIIAASAGFDQYIHCWGSNLSTKAFYEIGFMMYEFAKEKCDGKRYGVLEGGYNHEDLGRNVLAFCEGLRGVQSTIL
ncbi:MAG: Histone deacetylase-like amidohydrolase [Candidatus Thorarchaeota archaeon]|nr:MAG: Histone deacetylase-like amidohydrolase [Candidatus Thorarchaeota archaeon]